MLQTSFHRTTGKPGRTTRLEVEALEGRDVLSTLPALVHPTPPIAWHAPALVCVIESTASAGSIAPKGQANANPASGPHGSSGAGSHLLGGGNIDLSHADPVRFSIARSIGEEIPQ
jgi:hypothetical protein